MKAWPVIFISDVVCVALYLDFHELEIIVVYA